jgi:hypothetical protein
MAMLSVFFVAPAGGVPAEKLNEGVPSTFPSVQCNIIDDLKVASLETILTGRDTTESIKALMNRCVYSHDGSGISVLQLGDGLVQALAAETPERALTSAKSWLAGSPWGRFGRRSGDLQDLADMISKLGKLASTALAPGHGLYLWICP